MRKLYNFRLDIDLIKEIDKLDGTRAAFIRKAIQKQLQLEINPTVKVYNMQLQDLLQDQVTRLTNDKKILKNENEKLEIKCEFYRIESMPFFKRRRYKKALTHKLPRGMQ